MDPPNSSLSALLFNYLFTSGIFYWSYLGSLKPPTISKEYDFIIVGGGSAGAVLANRLTENPAYKVLLLESGGAGNYYTDIPYLYPAYVAIQPNPLTKVVLSEPQNNVCLEQRDNRCLLYYGNALGG